MLIHVRSVLESHEWLVMVEPSTGESYIMDFGIARDESLEDLTLPGQALGTPSYMSPEQWDEERPTTHRSDIYSLGCILYEMLTGRKVFESKKTA